MLLGLGLVSPAARAAADVPLEIAGRRLSIVMDHDQALLVYRLALRGRGEFVEDIALPPGGVATGLRVVLRGAPPVLAPLQDRDAAQSSFDAESAGKSLALRVLLSHQSAGLVSLSVVGTDATVEAIEVSALAPLEYGEGSYTLESSILAVGFSSPVSLSAMDPKEEVWVDGAASAGLVLTPQHFPRIALRPRMAGPLVGSLGSFPLGDQHVVRGKIAAPANLGATPRGAHVALVLDRSWSADESWHESKVAARAYLQSMQDANVDIITFHRKVTTPFGRNLPVAQAMAALESDGPDAGNGSRMDEALALADSLLAASPIKERRIVVLSDFNLRRSLAVQSLAGAPLRSGAVVHFATVTIGGEFVQRDDDAPWAPVPRRNGGLFYRAQASGDLTSDTVSTFEEWARPKHIGRLAVAGVPSNVFEAPTELAAGQETSFFGFSPVAATELQLQGELWSKPFRLVVRRTPEATQRAKVFAFGGALLDDVPEAARRALAYDAHVVSPETSFYFERPGSREPSSGSASMSGFGTHSSCGCQLGRATPLPGLSRTDRELFLSAELAKAKGACGATDRTLAADIETTLHEVVDLHVIDASPARDPKVIACVEEKLWDTTLPRDFKDERVVYRVP